MDNSIVLGVDIGGSHITAALVDVEKRILIENSKERYMVDSGAAAAYILEAWRTVINGVYSINPALIKNIGIAMPGPFDYENGICLIEEQVKFRALYGLNLKQELASKLAISTNQITFINDAAAFLQGEMFAGECRGIACALGFTLGTGLGAALYRDRKTRDAALWNALFRDGIAEDYLSTRWFVKRYHELSGNTITGVKELVAMPINNTAVKQVFDEFGANFASFLIPLVPKYEAEAVIVGGNIAQAFAAFSPALTTTLKEHGLKIPILKSMLGEQAALLGAASYAAST